MESVNHAVIKAFLASLVLIMATDVLNSDARRETAFRRIARIHEFDNCRDRSVRPFHILQRRITLAAKNIYTLNAEGICEKGSQKIEHVVVNITKCADKSQSKCEYVRRLEWKPSAVICPLFKLRGTPWDKILEAFSPQLGCVYRKGKFTVRNLTYDFDRMEGLQVGGDDYYVASFEFFDENNLPWMCFLTESSNPRVRVQ